MEKLESKSRVLYIVSEVFLRSRLTDLYVSIVSSSENASSLLTRDPDTMNWALASGNDLAKGCQVRFSRWLGMLRHFTISSKAYSDHFMEPSKAVASFLLNIRKQDPFTTCLPAYVYSISNPHYDKVFRGEMVTLSMLVPSLQTAMSMRIRIGKQTKILHGMQNFSKVQPIPLVNRMHPVAISVESSQSTFELAKQDYLKACFADVNSITSSLAMEHFCEVESWQSKGRHHLGATLILGGKLVSVNEPRLTLQSITDKNSAINMLISRQLYENTDLERLDSLQNKFVRIIVVFWYTTGLEGESHPEYPEVFYIEPVDDEMELMRDELIGYVRMRSHVRKEVLANAFPSVDLKQISELVEKNGVCELSKNVSYTDSIVEEFVKTSGKIKELRHESNYDEKGLAIPEELFSEEKISIGMLSGKLKNDQTMQNIFLRIIKYFDITGRILSVSELKETFSNIDREVLSRNRWWFRFTGMITTEENNNMITKVGWKVACMAFRETIRGAMSSISSKAVFLPEVSNELPTSLIFRALKDDTNGLGFSEVSIDGKASQLFWMSSSDSDSAEQFAKSKRKEFFNIILSVFRSSSHPLTSSKVVEVLNEKQKSLDHFSVKVLLLQLEACGKIKRDGESWVYQSEDRILDVMTQNPDSLFSIDKLMQETTTALMDREEFVTTVNSLEKEGKISKIAAGLWSALGNEEGKQKQFLMLQIGSFLLKILKQKNGRIDKNVLFGMIGGFAHKMLSHTQFKDWRQICNDTIKKLIDEQKIILIDDMYVLKDK